MSCSPFKLKGYPAPFELPGLCEHIHASSHLQPLAGRMSLGFPELAGGHWGCNRSDNACAKAVAQVGVRKVELAKC